MSLMSFMLDEDLNRHQRDSQVTPAALKTKCQGGKMEENIE